MDEIMWKRLDRKMQDLYLSLLWKDGHSEKAIADFLHIGKGVIVRRRHSHLKKLARIKRVNVKSVVDRERFQDLLDLHNMREMEKRGVSCIAPIIQKSTISGTVQASSRFSARGIQKLAVTETTQCVHKDDGGRRCAYVFDDAKTRLCRGHS